MARTSHDTEWATTEVWRPSPPRGKKPKRRGLSNAQALGLVALAAAATGAVIYANRKPRRRHAIPGKTIPRGKGVFIRKLTTIGTPDQLAELVAGMGLDYVIIHVIWQHSRTDYNTFNLPDLPDYVRALRRRGIRIWLWGFPHSGAIDLFVDTMAGAGRLVNADGFIVDSEANVYRATPEQAKQLTAGLREASGGKPVGVASYMWPPYHPPVPYEAYAEHSNFGAPMVYDKDRKYSASDYANFVKAWQDLGFAGVLPIWGASAATSVSEMRDISAGTPVTDGAVAWWDLYHLKTRPDAAAFVRNYRIPSSALA